MMVTTVRCEGSSCGVADPRGSHTIVIRRVEILAVLSFLHAPAMRLPSTHMVVALGTGCPQIQARC